MPLALPEDIDDKKQGEMIEVDEPQSSVVDMEDGGAIIELEEQAEAIENPEHFVNLAETLEESVLTSLATELIDLIDEDKQSREQRDKIYAEGIKRTGLGEEAPGGAEFTGASKVVHPLITEVCIDFSARVMKELFPASGPVKQHIPGTPTKEKLEKSRRKAKHMNWQFTKQIKEFRSELEQTLTQVPLGGAAYIKISHDKRHKRPCSEFIPIDDIIYPFAASSFQTAERKTHRRNITELKLKRYVNDGTYRDIDLVSPLPPEETKSETASNKIEGKKQDASNSDGLRTVYETVCYLDIETPDQFDPYLVTIDETSQRVLAIYRNWDEEDEDREELIHIVEFPFVPWRGAAPIGITHMIGSISGAATGALRALLDSAHINNVPTAFKLKGGIKGGQTLTAKATEIKEIDGAINTDDIRKAIMPMPFNPPSEVLFQLLGFLIKEGRQVVQTTFENIADQKTDMPVGTTLALIEQGMTVFSAIHGRLHNSMQQVMEIVHRINAKHMTVKDIKEDLGEIVARPSDYQGPMDVIPVSDPNIFSEVQRQAQIALIAQRAGLPFNLQAGMYNLRRVEKLILEYAKIPAPEELLNPIKEPMRDNAVNENVKATMGNALVTFPEQNHEAHIATHLAYMVHPMFGGSPLIAPNFIPAMVSHLRDHIAFWYVSKVVELASEAAGIDIDQLMDADQEVSEKFDMAMQQASEKILVTSSSNQTMTKLSPIIAKAMEYIQQHQPPMPMDPSAVAAQEVKRKSAADAQKSEFDKLEFQHKQQSEQLAAQQQQQKDALEAKLKSDALVLQQQKDERAAALEAEKMASNERIKAQELAAKNRTAQLVEDAENQRSNADNEVKLAINTADNDTAMRIAAAEVISGERVAVSTGGGINPG